MKLIVDIKLKGGVLYLVTGASLVMALVLSSIIVLQFYYKLYSVNIDMTIELERNIDSTFEWIKAQPDQFLNNEGTFNIQLFSGINDSVNIFSNYWGLYHIIEVEAINSHKRRSRSALLGLMPNESHSKALVMSKSPSKLKLLGETIINGNVSVPFGKVFPGWLNGISFQRQTLVNGKVESSPIQLPKYDVKRVEKMKNILIGENDFMTSLGLLNSDTSYAEKRNPLFFTSDQDITIKNKYSGKIIFHSSSEITVDKTSKLEGVILVAPKIIIKDFVIGSFQAFAKNSIIVGNGVKLNYPSCLTILPNASENSVIEIGASSIDGAVVQLSKETSYNKYARVILHNKANVLGEVYVNGVLEHYGKLTGNIVCDKIVFSKGGVIRENSLWNATIDRLQLSENYVFTFLQKKKKGVNIIKWL